MAFSEQAHFSPSFDTFEHVHQRSYSHGLEKIYALENVNIHSIRKITAPRPIERANPSKKITSHPTVKPVEQLEFSFEFPFQKSLPSFLYREPIQVLTLSKRLEQQLLAQDKCVLGDLLQEHHQGLPPFKGIGQGHIDEIGSKIERYLDEHASNENTRTIHFTSWLKSLVGDLDSKKCAVLLEAYHLPPLLPLSPAEIAELRKMTPEKRSGLLEEALLEVRTAKKKELLDSDLKQIAEISIKPWLRQRNGIATRHELQECLLGLGDFYPYVSQCLDFIGNVYFKGSFPLIPFLIPLSDDLYCDSQETAETYHQTLEIAHSYFYDDHAQYTLETLIQWIGRELAARWIQFTTSYITRALRLSPDFRVRKNSEEQLIIKRS